MSDVSDYGDQLQSYGGLEQVPDLAHLYRLAAKSRFTVIELLNEMSPLRQVLERAAAEANAALDELIDADLYTDAGVAHARKLQNIIQRHMDLMRWVDSITSEGDEAAHVLRTAPIDDFEIIDGAQGENDDE